MVPAREKCIKMLDEHNVPCSVQKHCILVADIAVYMAELLNRKGYKLDLKRIEAAALLHDIERAKHNHAAAGAKVLIDSGCTEVAEIVLQHMKPDLSERDKISEITVVYLADKYAAGDKIVELKQRFQRKMEIFAGSTDALKSAEENYRIAQNLQYIFESAIGDNCKLIDLFMKINKNGGL